MTQSERQILYLASKNKHKLKELSELIGNTKWDLRLATELDPNISWDETGKSFMENASIKAAAVKKLTGEAVLADDSGLSVASLGGAPGIHSSRYAGENASDDENTDKLLEEMSRFSDEEREAKFVCCIVFINDQGQRSIHYGECRGEITTEKIGNQGFGYDPIFRLNSGKTMAELSEEEKNSISHRSNAIGSWLRSMSPTDEEDSD